jgi:hypothetical protein
MKGNLHGFLLAAVMIVIAVGGTVHHLATGGAEPAAESLGPRAERAGVGLVDRTGRTHDAGTTAVAAELSACEGRARGAAGAPGPGCDMVAPNVAGQDDDGANHVVPGSPKAPRPARP